MPNTVKKINGKWRVVEKNTGKLTKNKKGTPVSKGFKTKKAAQKQATAINMNSR